MRNSFLNKIILASACAGLMVACGKKDKHDDAVAVPTPAPVAPGDPFQIQGAELLNNPQGKGQITFTYPGADTYGCTMSQGTNPGQENVCAGALTVDMPALKTSLAAGKWQLMIKAKKGQQVLATKNLEFCNGDCNGTVAQNAQTLPMKVGNYGITLNPNYVVNIFARVDTTSQSILVSKVGSCKNSQLISFAGAQPAQYCENSTMIQGLFRLQSGFTTTANSAVISSTQQFIQQNPSLEKQIHIKHYDSMAEFKGTSSRFNFLCGGISNRLNNMNAASGNFNGDIQVQTSKPIVFAQGYFSFNSQSAVIPTCTMVDSNGRKWRVGAVLVENNQIMSINGNWDAFCGQAFANRTIMEIVYQERINDESADYESLLRSMSDTLTPMLKPLVVTQSDTTGGLNQNVQPGQVGITPGQGQIQQPGQGFQGGQPGFGQQPGRGPGRR